MNNTKKVLIGIAAVFLLCGLSYIKTAYMGLDPASYSSINAAVTAAGSSRVTMIVSSSQTLAGSLTVPSNVTLKVLKSGMIIAASTYSLTINGHFEAGLYQCFSGFSSTNTRFGDNGTVEKVYPQWWGANGAGTADDTTAFASALYALPAGGKLHIVQGTYKVTSGLVHTSGHNRITIEGEGLESNINYTPALSSTTFLTGTGTLDTIVYRNFGVHMTNPTTRTKTTAFYHQSGDTQIFFEGVRISNFNEYGIHLQSGVLYNVIEKCSFVQIRDTLSNRIAMAIYGEGNNVTRIEKCLFSQNDRSIYIAGGTPIQVLYNSMELDGSNGNTLVDYTQVYSSIKALKYIGNYVEGSSTPVSGAAVYFSDCILPEVTGNLLNGQDGPTDLTRTMLKFAGSSSFGAKVYGNAFDEVITYFINTAVPIELGTNWYRDGSAVKSSLSSISPYLTDTTLMDWTQKVGNVLTRTSSETVTTAGGVTTHPTQPMFIYTSTGQADVTGDGTTYTVLWNTLIKDVQSNKSTASNIAVNATGNWLFCADVTLEGILNTHNNFTLTINTTARQYQSLHGGLIARNDETYHDCVIAPMTSGDTVNIRIYADSGTKVIDVMNDGRYNRFSGTLLN